METNDCWVVFPDEKMKTEFVKWFCKRDGGFDLFQKETGQIGTIISEEEGADGDEEDFVTDGGSAYIEIE